MSHKHEFSNSFSIRHIDYDNDEGCLIVCFASGGTYKYPGCSMDHHKGMKEAISPGRYFQEHLRKLKSEKI